MNNTQVKKKGKRGGARPGAGRPPISPDGVKRDKYFRWCLEPDEVAACKEVVLAMRAAKAEAKSEDW
jgi:hypothetical protein